MLSREYLVLAITVPIVINLVAQNRSQKAYY